MDIETSKDKAHSSALLAGYFLGGATALFSVVASFIRLTEDSAFEVDVLGMGDVGGIGLLLAPLLMFCVGYLFAFIALTLMGWLATGRDDPGNH